MNIPKMKIASLIYESTIDYPGKYGPVIFTSGCNYNCGYCHNPELTGNNCNIIDKEEIDTFLKNIKIKSKSGWYNGITISGGEPTMQLGLKNFVKEIKDLGFLVKLDTNGSNYRILQELKNEKLVDYVAMDVKGPVQLYPLIIGKKFIDIRDDVGKGISIVSQFPDYEFRTTVSLVYENEKPRWMTPKEVGETAELISDWASKEDGIKYILQPFKAIDKKGGNKRFMKENLSKEFHETPSKHIEECLIEAQKHIPNTKIR